MPCCARSGSPSTGPEPLTRAEIEAVLGRHADALLAIPGVVGVAVGDRRGRLCLQVLVDRWTPEVQEGVPASVESFPVEVKATGDLRALGEESPGDGDPT